MTGKKQEDGHRGCCLWETRDSLPQVPGTPSYSTAEAGPPRPNPTWSERNLLFGTQQDSAAYLDMKTWPCSGNPGNEIWAGLLPGGSRLSSAGICFLLTVMFCCLSCFILPVFFFFCGVGEANSAHHACAATAPLGSYNHRPAPSS